MVWLNKESQLRFPEYVRLSCVYVRYIQDSDTYYIGQTGNLISRYPSSELGEIIYYEKVVNPWDRTTIERRMIREFYESGLPLMNKHTFERRKK